MVDKKGKPKKHIDHDQKKTPDVSVKKDNISGAFLDEIKGAFTAFNTVSQTERVKLYGDKQYLEQFWEYFKLEHPNLLDKMDKKDLPVYLEAIENK
jgi:hypothetical protein